MQVLHTSSTPGIPNFGLVHFDLRDVVIENNPKSPRRVENVTINGSKYHISGNEGSRFMNSLCARYGVSPSFFTYYHPSEVIERVCQRREDTKGLTVTTEFGENRPTRLLAVNNPDEHDLDLTKMINMAVRMGAELSYVDGRLWAKIVPDSGARSTVIGGDEFRNRFVFEAPVDGFGKIRTFLELLRLICTNGAIGYAPAFASQVNPGKDVMTSIERALTGFDNPDGFVRIQKRFEAAQSSQPSIAEMVRVQAMLGQVVEMTAVGEEEQAGMLIKYNEAVEGIVGSVTSKYGIINPGALHPKKQAVLPMGGTMYDILNLITEIGTHDKRIEGRAAMKLNGSVGEMLAGEFDLEGSIKGEQPKEFKAFHMN